MANSVHGTLDLKHKSIEDQLKKLRKIAPNVKFEDNVSSVSEGYVLPLWQSLACTYPKALEKVFDKIDDLHGIDFVNCLNYKEGLPSLSTNEDVIVAVEKIRTLQGNSNYIIVPAQIGKLTLGRSVEEVLVGLLGTPNFGLTSFHVGVILLTHYDRIAGGDSLWINCPGDSVSSGQKSEAIHVPFFTVTSRKIWFCTHPKTCKGELFGSATTI
jgi:hypothetical protein